jgi:Fe-S cluster assembly protein SufD
VTAPVKLSEFESALVEALPSGDLRGLLADRGLPHRRVEAWKWTDLRTVLARFPAAAGTVELDASRQPDAVAELDREPSLIMPRLAAALGGDCAVFELKDNERLTLEFTGEGAGHRILAVSVPDGVTAVLHEIYRAEDNAFANIALNIVVGEGAQLTRVIEQREAPGAALVVTTGISLAAGARVRQTTLGFGAKLARLETHVAHAGHGAQLRMDGAYVLGDGMHLDQTSIVRHTGPDGVTDELFKGAAAKGGRGVFQGKIHVEKAAQKTDAQMQHRGILLEDGAEIDAKPELEIYADDVVCAHGNAFGAIDEDALFYMRQRGLPDAVARALLTESFLAAPIDRLDDEELREVLSVQLKSRLEALL